ncbi:MAG: hypothetical protein NVS3B21_28060 [Acidimicrobiales bacterium]
MSVVRDGRYGVLSHAVGRTADVERPHALGMGINPVAEVDFVEPMVRALLAEQHPDLADLATAHEKTGDHPLRVETTAPCPDHWAKVKRTELRVASKFGPQVMGEGLANRRHAQHVPEDVAIEPEVAFDGRDFFG